MSTGQISEIRRSLHELGESNVGIHSVAFREVNCNVFSKFSTKNCAILLFFNFCFRLMSPRFADGLSAPRISTTGHDLPLSRVVSRTMHPDEGYHDHAGTVMIIAWGQFMDHDYTLTATPLGTLHSETQFSPRAGEIRASVEITDARMFR